MIILGITGSIGTGKTTISNLFKEYNAVIFDDDKIVHTILNSKVMLKYFVNNFGYAIKNNRLDKHLLRNIVLKNYNKLKELESILHPLVNIKRRLFILKHFSLDSKNILIFDTPLLFEKELNKQCSYTLVTYCNKELQKERVLSRGIMNEDEFNFILSNQLPSEKKIQLADFSINTEVSIDVIKIQVKNIFNIIKNSKN